MATVWCDVEETELENDEGYEIPSVCVTCRRCEHSTESYGTGGASVRRCLALLREECPNDESNYYMVEEDYDADD